MGQYVKRRDVSVEAIQLKHRMTLTKANGNVDEADPGDYLVNGVHGEQYFVKAHVFEATYRRVGEGDD